MPNFPIASGEPLEIGKRYQGLANNPWGHNGRDQPFIPVKEITWEEFIELYVTFAPDDREGAAFLCIYATHFYEVLTD